MDKQDPQIVCYVVRHGTTTLNANGMFRGNKNPPLDEKGIKDAHKIASLLSNIDLSYIISSDRTRAIQTADIISDVKKTPVHKTENLRALDVGNFSGQKRTPEAEAELQKYIEDPETPIPGGESLSHFKARILPCVMEAVELFKDTGIPPVLIAHSSIVHEIGSICYGDHKSILVDPGGAIGIFIDNKGKLGASPIFKPAKSAPGTRAQTVS